MDKELAHRRRLADAYRKGLAGLAGVRLIEPGDGVEPNHAYLPVLIDDAQFGLDRDGVYTLLKRCNIHPRKYFYPLCSHFSCYAALPSAAPGCLPVAERFARQVLCLPIYGTLAEDKVERICRILSAIHGDCTKHQNSDMEETKIEG